MALPRKYKNAEKINDLLETNFERDLFDAACKSLIDSTNKLRFNNFAYGIRELARHFLNRLAPDSEVVKCSWYIRLPDSPVATRAQKVQYSIQRGLSNDYIAYLDIDINYYYDLIKIAFDRLNKFTHVGLKTFGISDSEIIPLLDEISEAFHSFSKAIKDCKEKLINEIESHIDDAFIQHELSDSIEEIRELSTHQLVDEIYPEDYSLIELNHDSISVTVTGKIYVQLQYGSNSDNRKGDGFKMNERYPFKSELVIGLNSFPDYSCELKTFDVDTSSFYG